MAPPFAPVVNPILNPTYVGGQVGPASAQGPQGCVGLQVADITLTSAQILAIQTGAITLIPAPGVTGFYINVFKIVMRLIGGSVAYTDAGGAVSFACGGLSVALSANTIFLVTVSPNRRTQIVDWAAAAVGVGVLGTAANPPTEDNAPFTISKATNNFAAGNGTMHLTLYYTVEQSL